SSAVRSFHHKQPSQTNVAKLLTKYAAPNPFSNPKPPHPPSSLRNPANIQAHSVNTATGATTQPTVDIGKYDGGLEIEDEKRGEVVTGEAAEALALDSSTSKSVPSSF